MDLHELGSSFTKEEVWAAINQMPNDKAPRPDGFTGTFFESCWETIKVDVMRVIHSLGMLQATNLHWLNSASVVLLPKKEGAEDITDFWPISLIHANAKIIAKILALRLAPFMEKLVPNA